MYSIYAQMSAVVHWNFNSLGCSLLPNWNMRLVVICYTLSWVGWTKRLCGKAGCPVPTLLTSRVYEYINSVIADDCWGGLTVTDPRIDLKTYQNRNHPFVSHAGQLLESPRWIIILIIIHRWYLLWYASRATQLQCRSYHLSFIYLSSIYNQSITYH